MAELDEMVLTINTSGYSVIKLFHFSVKYNLTVTIQLWYSSSLFDENLYEHINRELADYVGRESDTS